LPILVEKKEELAMAIGKKGWVVPKPGLLIDEPQRII